MLRSHVSLVLGLASFPTALEAQGCFDHPLYPALNIPVGPDEPSDLAFADLDGIHGPDLVAVIPDDHLVTVCLSLGDGTFAAPVPYASLGLNPVALAVADFDGADGPDIAVANENSDVVAILTNDGAGGFSHAGAHVTDADPRDLAVADFDGVNGLDLAVANSDGDTVSLLLNDGSGGFLPGVSYPVGDHPIVVAPLDMDGIDGPDLAVLTDFDDRFEVLMNDGSGGLLAGPSESVISAKDLAVGELDGVLGPDVVVVSSHSSHGAKVYLNGGSGTFLPPTTFPDDLMREVVVGDVDGVGGPDFLVRQASTYVKLFLNQGSGSFVIAPALLPLGGLTERGMALVDLDGVDGLDVANPGPGGHVTVHLNRGGGSFSPQAYPAGASMAIVSADFDLDGDDDVAVHGDEFSTWNLGLWLNDGGGSFEPSSALDAFVPSSAQSFQVGDLDGSDGLADLFLLQSDTVELLQNHGGAPDFSLAGSFYDDYWTSASLRALGVGDVDGLNGDDLVLLGVGAGGSYRLWLHSGGTTYTLGASYDPPAAIPSPQKGVAIADLDGQGWADVVWVGESSPDQYSVLVWRIDPAGPDLLDEYPVGRHRLVALGDLDGVNGPDLVVAGPSASIATGLVAVLPNNGDGTFGPLVSYTLPGPVHAVRDVLVGDLDAEDGLDVAVLAEPRVQVLLNAGDGTLTPPVPYPATNIGAFGVTGFDYSGALGDFNGESGLDLAVPNPIAFGVLLSTGYEPQTLEVFSGQSIQTAIDQACSGDEILVHPGAYNEALDLLGKTITLRSSGGPDVTTLKSTPGTVIRCDSGEGPGTVIEGFTIRKGAGGALAGGLHCVATSPTVRDCVFEDNSSDAGGAMVLVGSSARVVGCTFVGNTADVGDGGAVLAANGSPTFDNCRSLDNLASDDGGAIAMSTGGSLELVNCVFDANTALGQGGAVHVDGLGTTLSVTQSTFRANASAPAGGGALAAVGFAGAQVVRNSILWGNTKPQTLGAYDVGHSVVEDGYAGTGIVDADPLFGLPDGLDGTPGTLDDDLRLRTGSPAVDAGLETAIGPDLTDLDGDGDVAEELPLDLDGLVRRIDDPATADCAHAPGTCGTAPTVDMGAYEYTPDLGLPCSTPSHYGAATPGSGGIAPTIEPIGGPPDIGNSSFAVAADDVVGGGIAVLGVGFGQAAFPVAGVTLLLDPLQPIFWFVAVASGTPGSPGAGQATFPLPLQAKPAWVGVEIDVQLLTVDPGGPEGVAASDGLMLVLCQIYG